MGKIISRASVNASGIRWECFTENGRIRADTLAGMKQMIKETTAKPVKEPKALFFVEMTDTYGEEANYSWVSRFMVSASTMLGAIGKVTRETGHYARKA